MAMGNFKTLIVDSVERASAGSKLADHAGETMGEIVAAVKRVTDIMAEISAASIEQGAGIAQVNEAIAQMDQVTQQNASLVEEVAATAGSLQDLAQTLVASTHAFTLEDQTRGFGKAAVAPRRAASPVTVRAARTARTARAANPKSQPSTAAPAAGDDEWQTF